MILPAALLPAAVAVLQAAALATPHAGPSVDGTSDTVLVRSGADAPTWSVDAVHVLWWSDQIDRPTTMTALPDRLVVGDRTRVHLVPLDGRAPWTVGRNGDGPGEYRGIASVGTMGDSILVLDSRAQRLSVLSADGRWSRSVRVVRPEPYVEFSTHGEPLVVVDGRVLSVRHELVDTRRRGKEALVSFDPSTRDQDVVRTWDGVRWTDVGKALAPAGLFDYGTLVAVGLDGPVAAGRGVEYCVYVDNPKGKHVLRVCRDGTRARVGREIRSPDLSLAPNPLMKDLLASSLKAQEIPDLMPSYDRLWWGQDGRLWVRTVGEDLAHVHPWLLWDHPERGPERRRWDVFDEAGALTRTVLLPSNLDPRVMTPDHVYGFLTLGTGEVVIGSADLEGAAP